MIVIDWPPPPSVNNIYGTNHRTGGKYLLPAVRKFRRDAGQLVMAVRPRPRQIEGPFSADITFNRQLCRGDLDNREKQVLDAAQHTGLISDDKHCQHKTTRWGTDADAPLGCRLTLRPIEDVS